MRTTLDIDDDILSASKALAKAAGKAAGQIISDLARKALTQPTHFQVEQPIAFYGIRPFPKRPGGVVVTNEMINRIRDAEGI